MNMDNRQILENGDCIINTTGSGILIRKEDGMEYWVMPNWIREDGTLTFQGVQARMTAEYPKYEDRVAYEEAEYEEEYTEDEIDETESRRVQFPVAVNKYLCKNGEYMVFLNDARSKLSKKDRIKSIGIRSSGLGANSIAAEQKKLLNAFIYLLQDNYNNYPTEADPHYHNGEKWQLGIEEGGEWWLCQVSDYSLGGVKLNVDANDVFLLSASGAILSLNRIYKSYL